MKQTKQGTCLCAVVNHLEHRRASSKIFGVAIIIFSVAIAGKNRFRGQFLSNYRLFRIFLLWQLPHLAMLVARRWMDISPADLGVHVLCFDRKEVCPNNALEANKTNKNNPFTSIPFCLL